MHIPRHPDRFVDRHMGPDPRDVVARLEVLGKGSLDALIDATVPAGIRLKRPLDLPPGRSEHGLLQDLQQIAAKNQVFRSYLGMGYSDTVTPAVIQRNILENPGWYTQYTPYQPEISQGRLEALLNYQTMVIDLTGLAVIAADLLSLCLLTPPGELGADVAVGSSQRLGVPLGYGGPHAAYFACREEHVRHMPGRIIGVSQDAQGRPALRMALQTREQHIRREKATSNICTAQALLAIIASMYAVYHGPRGLKAIAQHVHDLTALLAAGLRKLGIKVRHQHFFDMLAVEAKADEIVATAAARRINLRRIDARTVSISLDETCSREDVENVLAIFGTGAALDQLEPESALPQKLVRTSAYLTHPV